MKNQPPLQAGNSGIPGSGCLGFSWFFLWQLQAGLRLVLILLAQNLVEMQYLYINHMFISSMIKTHTYWVSSKSWPFLTTFLTESKAEHGNCFPGLWCVAWKYLRYFHSTVLWRWFHQGASSTSWELSNFPGEFKLPLCNLIMLEGLIA